MPEIKDVRGTILFSHKTKTIKEQLTDLVTYDNSKARFDVIRDNWPEFEAWRKSL